MNELTNSDRAIALSVLQKRICSCRLCQDRGYIQAAHPLTSGRYTDRVMIIGQAPGHRSVANERSFSGPGGTILQKWLERAGFPPNYLRNHTYLSSLTRCDPGPNPKGDGDRRPSAAELALCRPYLETELLLLRPQIALLVGSMAIEAFCGKTRMEEIIGTSQEHNGIHFLPLPHPSGVSRWLLTSSHQALLQQALDILNGWRTQFQIYP